MQLFWRKTSKYHQIFSGCYCLLLLHYLYITCCYHSYFSQTIGLMGKDDSIYCISAWNDLVSVCMCVLCV